MKAKRHLMLLTASAALVVVFAGAAFGQISAANRDVFIKTITKGCSDEARKSHPNYSESVITTYCGCIASGQADFTTMADMAYIREHKEASDDYKLRMAKLYPHCNAAAGLH